MADNRHFVDDARTAAGRQILAMMDEVGFDAYAAGWIHDGPTNTWRYILSTPMLKSKGPIWIYDHLLRMFRFRPLPDGVSPLDVFVIDPDYELALFGDLAVGSQYVSQNNPMHHIDVVAFSQDMVFPGFAVTDGFVVFYRKLAQSDRNRRRDPVRTFDHKIRQLEAA